MNHEDEVNHAEHRAVQQAIDEEQQAEISPEFDAWLTDAVKLDPALRFKTAAELYELYELATAPLNGHELLRVIKALQGAANGGSISTNERDELVQIVRRAAGALHGQFVIDQWCEGELRPGTVRIGERP